MPNEMNNILTLENDAAVETQKSKCLVYNKNTQNCRGDSPKLQREIPQ